MLTLSNFRPTLLVLSCMTLLSFSIVLADKTGDPLMLNPMMKQMSPVQTKKILGIREMVKEHGCKLRACFLLDGGRKVTRSDLDVQKNFVDLILAITTTDDPALYCGAVYSRRQFPIVQKLTPDREFFLRQVERTTFPPGYRRAKVSHLGRAIMFALRQMQPYGVKQPRKIIAFAKSAPEVRVRGLAWKLNQFRRNSGSICTIALDRRARFRLRKLAGNNRLFTVNDFLDLSEVVVATVTDVCGLPCVVDGDGEECQRKAMDGSDLKDSESSETSTRSKTTSRKQSA